MGHETFLFLSMRTALTPRHGRRATIGPLTPSIGRTARVVARRRAVAGRCQHRAGPPDRPSPLRASPGGGTCSTSPAHTQRCARWITWGCGADRRAVRCAGSPVAAIDPRPLSESPPECRRVPRAGPRRRASAIDATAVAVIPPVSAGVEARVPTTRPSAGRRTTRGPSVSSVTSRPRPRHCRPQRGESGRDQAGTADARRGDEHRGGGTAGEDAASPAARLIQRHYNDDPEVKGCAPARGES